MKIKLLTTISAVFLMGFILSACGGAQNTAVATEAPQLPAATEAQEPPTVAPENPGNVAPTATTAPSGSTVDAMALIQDKLQNHHGLDRILNAKHTREEWNKTLDRMIKYGAAISEEEKKIIIDYLLSRQ